MPRLSRYTIITLGFALKDELDIGPILIGAANEIVDSFPWLAGQVVVEKPAAEDRLTSSGTFKVVGYEPHAGNSKFVHVKNCRGLSPSFAELVKSRAPASMLDGRVICPAYGTSSLYPEDAIKPVVIMQANLIQGGVLLTICTHHCVMDANGNEQFIQHFGRICRGEILSSESVKLGNVDRNTIVRPLKPGQQFEPLDLYRCPSSLGAPRRNWPPGPATETWKTFRFTGPNIVKLKALASALCSPESDIKYISTDDAISTFIWTRLATIRSSWLPENNNTSLYRAVNGRRKLDPVIPAAYMGHAILVWPTKLPIRSIIDSDLSSITMEVRRSLLEVNDSHMRSFFHLLQNEKDKTTVAYGAKVNMKTDMLITSFVAQKLYKTSFGDILGEPSFIRRPNLPDGNNLYYLMPITGDGDIDLVAGLSKQEFDGLQKDGQWNEYVEIIG